LKPLKLFMSIMLIAILAACTIPEPSPTPSQDEIKRALDAIRTESALTVVAEIGRTNSATPLPELPTLAPTGTTPPTQTPLPTYTPYPTYTPFVLPTAIPRTPTAIATAKPSARLTILGVEKNTAVSVQADNFSANQVLKIRMGPYDTFSKDAVEVGTINSGKGPTLKFTALLPGVVKDVEKVTIRLDGSTGEYAYNTFTNETSGTKPTVSATVTSSICEVSVSPALGASKESGADFDAVWTVKNISGKTWGVGSTDYKYIKGTEMQKYEKVFDLTEEVKSGGKVTLRVDMSAPTDPGTYSATWALVQGSTVLCNLPVKIVVK
jgi:hypothetical protein